MYNTSKHKDRIFFKNTRKLVRLIRLDTPLHLQIKSIRFNPKFNPNDQIYTNPQSHKKKKSVRNFRN